jgi:hypothetical protein
MTSGIQSQFPLTGEAVCQFLRHESSSDQIWIIRSVETLTDQPSTKLGELWERVRQQPVEVSTGNLCDLLGAASQVISLDLIARDNKNIQVLIEDGRLVVAEFLASGKS